MGSPPAHEGDFVTEEGRMFMCLIMTAEGWQQLGNGKICSNHNRLEGVYRPPNITLVLAELAARADRFNAANSIGNLVEKAHHFRGDHFLEPIFGAFGEKL
jgi:hypothetical protein